MSHWRSQYALRYFSYAILILLLLQTLVWIAGRGDDALALFVRPKPTDVYGTSEFSVVEILQTALLLAAFTVTAWHARTLPDSRPLTPFFALFLLLMLVREQDYFIDQWLPWGTWRLPGVLVLLALLFVALRGRSALRVQGRLYAGTACFGLVFAGLLVLMGFSRVFGQTVLWTALLADDYQRIAKLAAEELTELLGYCLLLVGCIEFRYAFVSNGQSAGSGADPR